MVPLFRSRAPRKNSRRTPEKRRLSIERLESRFALSTLSVMNLNDAGSGSLRQAILDADAAGGSNIIDFAIAGTIQLTSGALPTITDATSIQGSTAPGWTAAPVVEINCNGFGGLQIGAGVTGGAISTVAIVNASGAGVTLNGDNASVTGNYIGVGLNGTTAMANSGDGLELVSSDGNTISGNVISGNQGNGIDLNSSADNLLTNNFVGTNAAGTAPLGNGQNGVLITALAAGNTLGAVGQPNVISGNSANGVLINSGSTGNVVTGNMIGTNAAGTAALGNTLDGVKVSGASQNVIGQANNISYYNTSSMPTTPTGETGIRGTGTAGQYYITGNAYADGVLFQGTIAGVGTSYTVNYIDSQGTTYPTNVYGPDVVNSTTLRLVGTYNNSAAGTVNSFIYTGTTSEFNNPANFSSLTFPGATYTYAHSTAGGLVVGNNDNPVDHGEADLPYGPGQAFLYNIAQQTWTDIAYPGSKTTSAYGIWYNGGTSYTIAGGYSMGLIDTFTNQNQPIGTSYMVDYNSATGQFSHWTSFAAPFGGNVLTHFQGISRRKRASTRWPRMPRRA